MVVTSAKNRFGSSMRIDVYGADNTTFKFSKSLAFVNETNTIYIFYGYNMATFNSPTVGPYAGKTTAGVYVDFGYITNNSSFVAAIINGYRIDVTFGTDGTQSYIPGTVITSGLQTNIGMSRSTTTWPNSNSADGSNYLDLVVLCLMGTTNILTPTGYKQLKDLKDGDDVIEDLETMNIIKIKKHIKTCDYRFKISVIPKNYYGDYPINDLHISSNHPYFIDGKRTKAIEDKKFKRYSYYEELYNLSFDKHTTFIADGLKVESVDYDKYFKTQ